MSYYNADDIKNALNQAVSATETLNDNDADIDTIKARLAVIGEISDGLGVSVRIPKIKKLIAKKYRW